MKKKFLLLLLVLSLFLLVGCNENSNKDIRLATGDEISDIIKNNASDFTSKHYEYTNFKSIKFNGEVEKLGLGIYRINYPDTSKMCLYSSYSEMIFYEGNINNKVRVFPGMILKAYIHIITLQGTTELYDLNGSLIFKAPYIINEIFVRNFNFPEVVLERILYRYEDDSLVLHKEVEDYIYFKKTKTRVISGKEDDYNPEQFYPHQLLDLAQFGLPNYYLTISDDNYIIFDNEKNIVNVFQIKYEYINGVFLIGRNYYVQMKVPTESKSSKYDLMDDTGKYNIKTKIIDILTGEVKDINFKKVLINNGAEGCFDENGEMTGLLCTGYEIQNKVKIEKGTFFINKNGEVEYKLPVSFEIDDIKKFGSHYLVNKVYYDSNLNIKSEFGSENNFNVWNKGFDSHNMVINAEYNKYSGLLDENLNIVIPFEYDTILTDYGNNYAAINSKQVNLIDKKYNIIKSIDYTDLTCALFMDVDENNKMYKVYTYDANINPVEFEASNEVEIDYVEIYDTLYAFFYGYNSTSNESTIYKMEIKVNEN